MMFNIDYTKSAEKAVVGKKVRQPVVGSMDMGAQLAEQDEAVLKARPQTQALRELDDDCPAEENEFH